MKSILLAIMLAFGAPLFAQTTLQFCLQVDSTAGKCPAPKKEFAVSKEGGTISLLLKNDKGLGTARLSYKIFYIDIYGNEKLSNTIEQVLQRDWTYTWKDVVFYEPGTYKIKVYNTEGSEAFLTSEVLKIFGQ